MQLFHSSVTPEFLDTYGLTLLDGKNLRTNGPIDEVIVNEFMVEKMGWDNPIGQTVPLKYGDIDHPHVIGVVKDFTYLHGAAPMFSLVLHQNPAMQKARVLIRLKPDLIGETVPQLEKIWKEVAPDAPSTLFTLDVIIERQMEEATNLMEPLGYTASIFGIMISCLGLFGLALHTLAQPKRLNTKGALK
jgi:putative ABC transport system permease protein